MVWRRHFPVLAWVALAVTPGVLGGVHEKLSFVPHGWTEAGLPIKSVATTFTIALQREFEGLEAKLLDLSTPGTPNYGKWLDRDAVEALYPPRPNATSKVVKWLQSNGISNYKVDGSFIDFSADIKTVNTVLDASYQLYRNSGVTKLRTLSYSIPDDLQNLIAFVDPGTFFGRLPASSVLAPSTTGRADTPSNTAVDASCQTSITPKCLNQLYHIGDYQPDPKSGSRIGFGSFLNQSAIYADLTEYERFFGIPSQNFTKVLIANGTNDQDSADGNYGEANLDVQNIIGVAHPLPVTEFITGGSPYVCKPEYKQECNILTLLDRSFLQSASLHQRIMTMSRTCRTIAISCQRRTMSYLRLFPTLMATKKMYVISLSTQ
jgi:tripeptidyl-peptidase-1